MNYPNPWTGGAWGLPDIVDYMDAGAMALLSNAAKNRRYWLENFYRINERAVNGWDAWPAAWVIPADQDNETGLAYVLRILRMGDVEVYRASEAFEADGESMPLGTYVVPMNQPYASFAQTLLEVQQYPDLREYPGGPPRRPYDVTAHTLPLLMNVSAVAVEDLDPDVAAVLESVPIETPGFVFQLPEALQGERHHGSLSTSPGESPWRPAGRAGSSTSTSSPTTRSKTHVFGLEIFAGITT